MGGHRGTGERKAEREAKAMKVSVVILNWNGCDMLRTFLPSVVRYSKGEGVEVCVADNGSTDASVEMLRQDFPSVRVILLDQNHGFADGYNLALQQVEADYVVLLNSDVEVTEHWLEPMIAYLDIHPEVAACQPKIRSWRQKDHFEYAGAAGGFLDKYGYPFCRGRIMGVVEKDEGQYDKVIPVFWATGAALVIRRADYKEVGGLDGREEHGIRKESGYDSEYKEISGSSPVCRYASGGPDGLREKAPREDGDYRPVRGGDYPAHRPGDDTAGWQSRRRDLQGQLYGGFRQRFCRGGDRWKRAADKRAAAGLLLDGSRLLPSGSARDCPGL